MAFFIFFILASFVLAKVIYRREKLTKKEKSVNSEYCPNGWMRHDSSCYLFVDITETWQDASAHCEAMDSRLAIVETEREDTFLRTTLLHFSTGAAYWLDGTDIATETEWVWASDQTPITDYTNWHPGQPDDFHSGEDCLRLTKSLGFQWDDGDCESKDSFICEKVDTDIGSPVIG